MAGSIGFTGPGTYIIEHDGKSTTIDADSLDYDGPDGSLQAHKDGVLVANFRWWSSIVKKDK